LDSKNAMKKITAFLLIISYLSLGILSSSLRAQDNSMPSILIASQNSKFKNALVEEIAQDLKSGGYILKIINLNKIPKEAQADYTVIIIINSCWAGHQTRITEKFLNHLSKEERQKVIVITTAKGIDWKNKITGIDAITSASKMNNIDAFSANTVLS